MISVIVPAFNAEITIGQCIEALLLQKIGRTRYEIIVVDDGSLDHTSKVVSQYGADLRTRPDF